MNVILTSLEALILKATNESLPCPDPVTYDVFCAVMSASSDGRQWAAQALASRIHSTNPREAMLALTMLDRCMRRGDSLFHAEVGKFRFLNEMIKLVSPKYFANKTAPEVRTRIIQLLYAWSTEYPKETKFRVAFDMLRNQGVITETPIPITPDEIPTIREVKNGIFEDEEKSKLLQKLLQSKKPEDLQHANRLIKTMVREEERRTEENCRRAQEVSAALDSAGLLSDMLERASEASTDEEQLIHELHASCQRMRPVLQQLAATTEKEDYLEDILHASDMLDQVFKKYNRFKEKPKDSHSATETRASSSLLDFAGGNSCDKAVKEETNKHVIDELGDIFSANAASNIAAPLKPISIRNNDLEPVEQKPINKEGWNELDNLGEELLKQSLPDNVRRLDTFNSKSTKKVPMNSIERASPKHESVPQRKNDLDLDFFTKKVEEKPMATSQVTALTTTLPNDDVMVDITLNELPTTSSNQINNFIIENKMSDNILDLEDNLNNDKTSNELAMDNNNIDNREHNKNIKSVDVKPLTDINVTIQSIKPSKVDPKTAFVEDGGLTVVLHFCKDKPRPDVNVVVISTTSKNNTAIEDYKFNAVVPKGCKARLLPSSGSSLPAYNPFLPPPALTQVMLIARPLMSPPIDLKFVITYTCDDETFSEMGEVKSLPLDDVE